MHDMTGMIAAEIAKVVYVCKVVGFVFVSLDLYDLRAGEIPNAGTRRGH